MTKNAADLKHSRGAAAPDADAVTPPLKPYHEPRLTDCGPLVELTHGIGGAPGDNATEGTVT
jgi:hypothetical protein